MAENEQFGHALLRIILISIATVIVGTIVITFVFLSSGNESGFLPPWQLVVAEATCVAILLHVSLSVLKHKESSSILKAAVAISAVLTIAAVTYFGIDHGRSLLGTVGQVIATFAMLAYPILLSAGVIIVMRRRAARTTAIWAVSMTLCLLLAVPMILVGLVFACAVGDCL